MRTASNSFTKLVEPSSSVIFAALSLTTGSFDWQTCCSRLLVARHFDEGRLTRSISFSTVIRCSSFAVTVEGGLGVFGHHYSGLLGTRMTLMKTGVIDVAWMMG